MFPVFRRAALAGATAVTMISCMGLSAFGQSTPGIRSSTSYTVKPDRAGDFTGAVKEFNAVLKKAGYDKSYTMWQSLTGPTEYRAVSYSSKWSEFDMTRNNDPKLKDVRGELTAIAQRIMGCVEKAERVIMQVNTALSLPRQAEPPKMIQSVKVRIRPDRVDEYLALVKSDMFPAIQKSDIKTFSIAQGRYGAPPYELRISVGMEKWADLDETPPPIVKAMGGQEAYNAYLKKARPLITFAEYNLSRYVPELSYRP